MSELERTVQIETEDENQDLQELAVLDDASADMIIQQLKTAESQYSRMKAWYDTQLSKLKTIRDRTRIWAETCLRPYMDMVPTTGKKIRSYDMEGATLKLSDQDPEYEVNDEILVPWLESNGRSGMVKVEKTAKWGELKETLKDPKSKKIRTIEDDDGTIHVITADGEIIPGITATRRDPKFTITVK